MTPPRILRLLFALSCVLPSTHAAQTTSGRVPIVSAAQRNTCPGCRIVATRTVQLGDDDGPGEIAGNPFLSCSESGVFALTASPTGRPTSILQFDAAGKYLRTLGRRGAGPGEFQAAFPVKFAQRDSLYAFDLMARRLTVFTPSGKVARTVAMPLRVSAASLLRDGRVGVFSIMGTAALPGAPLHIVDASGHVIKSFGADNPSIVPDDNETFRFVLAQSARGMWAARINEYRFSEYDANGELLRSITAPGWFAKWEPDKDRAKPAPRLIALQEDRSGVLWAMTSVPDKRYRTVPSGTPILQQPSESLQYDTVIEAIDLRTNTVLASLTLDVVLRGFGCEATAYAYREDAADQPHVDIWKVALQRPATLPKR